MNYRKIYIIFLFSVILLQLVEVFSCCLVWKWFQSEHERTFVAELLSLTKTTTIKNVTLNKISVTCN